MDFAGEESSQNSAGYDGRRHGELGAQVRRRIVPPAVVLGVKRLFRLIGTRSGSAKTPLSARRTFVTPDPLNSLVPGRPDGGPGGSGHLREAFRRRSLKRHIKPLSVADRDGSSRHRGHNPAHFGDAAAAHQSSVGTATKRGLRAFDRGRTVPGCFRNPGFAPLAAKRYLG